MCGDAEASRQLGMNSLSFTQRRLVDSLVAELSAIDGVRAIVLGGSFARGFARADSDIDLGVLYSEKRPFGIEPLRDVVTRLNDHRQPVVTDFYEWGRWVNGGAWLTMSAQRVDLLYRCLEHMDRVIADAEAGRYEIDYEQQPPFGFFGPTYSGEISICEPLFDPKGYLPRLKERVAAYPEALRRAVVRDCLWSVDFGLQVFVRKFAAAGDVYGTVGCLTRFANRLVLATAKNAPRISAGTAIGRSNAAAGGSASARSAAGESTNASFGGGTGRTRTATAAATKSSPTSGHSSQRPSCSMRLAANAAFFADGAVRTRRGGSMGSATACGSRKIASPDAPSRRRRR
jgi:predicted nucleotidyltransferase